MRKIEGLDALRDHPQVVQVNITLEAGAVIPKTESSFSRSGSFIVTADTYEGVQELIQDLLDRLKIEIEQEEGSTPPTRAVNHRAEWAAEEGAGRACGPHRLVSRACRAAPRGAQAAGA